MGSSLTIQWKVTCSKIRSNSTLVRIDIYENDVLSDDLVGTVTSNALAAAGAFHYTIPVDVTTFVSRGGEEIDSARFYFYIFSVSDTSLDGSSPTFRLDGSNAYLYVDDIKPLKLSTGGTFSFTLFAKNLPSRNVSW